jgi:hypothetical protein
LVTDERRRLLTFLSGLAADEWVAPTAAGAWTVKDLALHLLDDDLTWLSTQRDGDASGLVDMADRSRFVPLLAAKNQRFVDGARSLSRRVIVDLLEWTGNQIDADCQSRDLHGEGWVSWASSEAVPFWFNVAQEFTERWVHQQQIREAVGRVEDHAEHLPEVLRTFIWALPHQLSTSSCPGAVITVTIEGVASWTLTSVGSAAWDMTERAAERPTVSVRVLPDAAWRWLSGAAFPPDQLAVAGPRNLTEAVIEVRAVIV